MPAKGEREPESKPVRTTQTTATAPAPKPKPVPQSAPKQKVAPGVPMAGQSYAKRQADAARQAKAPASSPPPPPATRPKPTPPPRAEPHLDLDLDEDFDIDEDDVIVEEAPAPTTVDTPSRIYSTRRALAEQVNEDAAERPLGEGPSGIAAIRDRRESWKKEVKAKEEEGKSPYVMRWAKVSVFPLVYFLVSIALLRNIRYEYSDYYDYDSTYLLLGLIVGSIFLVIAATGTMLRAKRVKRPIQLKGRATWIGVIVFIGLSFYLAFYDGLAYAWRFSMGFLAAGLLIALIGFGLEKSGKGTYWVKDPLEASEKRWLEFVPLGEA